MLFSPGGVWRIAFDFAIEYLVSKKVSYNNPELPSGPAAQERNEYVAATLMLSKRW